MQLDPIYTADNLRPPAYHLRYTWSGWPSAGRLPQEPEDSFFESLAPEWEQDGLRLLERVWSAESIRFTFSVKPQVSPILFASRVKGRLQYALRKAGMPVKFSRKLGVRTIGDNHTEDVENYIRGQVEKEPLVDPRFKEFLKQFTVADPTVDLAFLNNLAYALGQNAVWEFSYYAGTFGEYDMGAVRGDRSKAAQTPSPAGKPAGVGFAEESHPC